MFDFKQEIANLPLLPGVYIMRDENGEIIYVGKAVKLKNRVRSYFQQNAGHTPKVKAMVAKIASFEYIVTDSEFEALILECNLIKENKPQYNILLKDDKGYPYIKITMNEEYPRMTLARKVEKDGAKYFGPFYSAWVVNETMDALEKVFPLKSCSKQLPRDVGKTRPCLNYYIGRCVAPCQGGVNKEEYRNMMKSVCSFLNGHVEEVAEELKKKMDACADRLEFEKAAEYRDKIEIVNRLTNKQKVAGVKNENIDIIGIAQNEIDCCIQMFFIRGGKAIGRDFFILEGMGADKSEGIISGFIKQFYGEANYFPPMILIPEEIEDRELLEKWISEKRMGKVQIKVPEKGDKKNLVKMSSANAAIQLRNFSVRCKGITETELKVLEKLKEMTSLEKIPARIEAYDISNTGTSENVASMVVFENGKANKKEYKRFKIKETFNKGDVESMREVLNRRLSHNEIPLPDIIMADGGLLHANMVEEALRESGREGAGNVKVFGMVKDDKHRTRGLIYEGRELDLKKDLEVFRFITSIQDEAHRFALEYNKKLRDKRYTASQLDEIDGVGKAKKIALLKSLGSLANIKKATKDELMSVKGISERIADNIINYFKESGK